MSPDQDRSAQRQDAILDAAFLAFSNYGYRRTTMDDIAQGAGISRTALYLHYRNKEDIFKSLAKRYFEEAVTCVAAELAVTGRSAADTLAAAFLAYDGKFMDVVLGTPHGAEMLEAGHVISADVIESGEVRIKELLQKWLEKAPLPEGLGSSSQLAATVHAALKGLKTAAKSPDRYRAAQRQLAQMVALALDR